MQFDETKPEPLVTIKTKNRTRFNYDEAPDGKRLDGFETFRQHYRLLNKINMGTHIRSHENPFETWSDEKQMRRAENLAVFDAVSSQMDLPKSFRRWGQKLFGELDLRPYKRQHEKGMGAVLAAVAVSAYIAKLKGWKTHPNHPEKHEELARLLDELGITEQEFRKTYGRVENRFGRRYRNLT